MPTTHTTPVHCTLLVARNHLERDDAGNYLRTTDPANGYTLADGTFCQSEYICTPVPAGSPAEIIGTESHGSNPWTRYTLRVELPDGRKVIVPGVCPDDMACD